MPAVIIDQSTKNVLQRAGWKFVGRRHAKKVAKLQELLAVIYVDGRRQRLVDALEEARKIASEL